MLTKNESRVMQTLFEECRGKSAVLISPSDLNKMIDGDILSLKELDEIVNALSLDGYFDLVYSDRKGESVYCITMTEKGKAYERSTKLMRRNLIFRICLTVGLAVLSFVVGIILNAIF